VMRRGFSDGWERKHEGQTPSKRGKELQFRETQKKKGRFVVRIEITSKKRAKNSMARMKGGEGQRAVETREGRG